MPRAYHRVLLIFADGVGLAPAGPDNPFARFSGPTFTRLLGGGLTAESLQRRHGLLLCSLDATLGVVGLPQSATGQTALFTGANAAAEVGRHVTGFPGRRLRALIAERSIFRRAAAAGLEATFANAYSDRYLEALEAGTASASVTTRAVAAAGLRFRTLRDLAAGEAVTWDVERDLFGRRLGGLGERWVESLEPIAARAAGGHLARVSARHHLTVFETFLPDLVGHGRMGIDPAEVVARLDGLLAGVLDGRDPDTTVLLTSDHGNFEDASVSTHTRAPVPLLAVGPAADEFADLGSLTGVAPRILELLAGHAARRRPPRASS